MYMVKFGIKIEVFEDEKFKKNKSWTYLSD